MHVSPTPSDVVESTLLGIITDPTKHEVILKFRMQDREFELRAKGVDDMLVNEFLHQNIVDEVRMLDRDSDSKDLRDLLATLLFNREQASDVTEPGLLSKLDQSVKAVVEGRKILLELKAVYGASVLLLAESIEWLY